MLLFAVYLTAGLAAGWMAGLGQPAHADSPGDLDRSGKAGAGGASLRVRVRTVEGVFLVYDAVADAAARGEDASYVAYWFDVLDDEVFVFSRVLTDRLDVGQALLALSSDLEIDIEAVVSAERHLSRSLADAADEPYDKTVWQIGSRSLVFDLMGVGPDGEGMGVEPDGEFDDSPEGGLGGIAASVVGCDGCFIILECCPPAAAMAPSRKPSARNPRGPDPVAVVRARVSYPPPPADSSTPDDLITLAASRGAVAIPATLLTIPLLPVRAATRAAEAQTHAAEVRTRAAGMRIHAVGFRTHVAGTRIPVVGARTRAAGALIAAAPTMTPAAGVRIHAATRKILAAGIPIAAATTITLVVGTRIHAATRKIRAAGIPIAVVMTIIPVAEAKIPAATRKILAAGIPIGAATTIIPVAEAKIPAATRKILAAGIPIDAATTITRAAGAKTPAATRKILVAGIPIAAVTTITRVVKAKIPAATRKIRVAGVRIGAATTIIPVAGVLTPAVTRTTRVAETRTRAAMTTIPAAGIRTRAATIRTGHSAAAPAAQEVRSAVAAVSAATRRARNVLTTEHFPAVLSM